MKITCECLVVKNSETGETEPLVLDFPDGSGRELISLRVKAYESGLHMKKLFTEQLIGKLTGPRLSKEDFQEVWDSTLGPGIESGDVT